MGARIIHASKKIVCTNSGKSSKCKCEKNSPLNLDGGKSCFDIQIQGVAAGRPEILKLPQAFFRYSVCVEKRMGRKYF